MLHGNRTFILQDDNGQITVFFCISAGLEYPGVGPEHAWLQEIGRAEYVGITDKEALDAFHYLCRTEGIIPALESSHAVVYSFYLFFTLCPDQTIQVNRSGRGDKDIGTVAGPHPYPMMVRDFQSVIGKECIEQMPAMLAEQKVLGQQPDDVIDCVGGGSNSMGIFNP